MVPQTLIGVSRNWSTVLTRTGCGIVVLAFYDLSGAIPREISLLGVPSTQLETSDFIILVVWSLVANLIGGIAIMVGSMSHGKDHCIAERLRLAEKVGKTGNPLLIEAFRDASGLYDLASGLVGSLIVGVLPVAFFALYSSVFGDAQTGVDGSFTESASLWEDSSVWIGFTFAILTTVLISKAATNGLAGLKLIIEKTTIETP